MRSDANNSTKSFNMARRILALGSVRSITGAGGKTNG